jgi:hypothetical protein
MTDPTPKPKLFRAMVQHTLDATKEPDGTPSSARIFAGILIIFVIFLQMAIICALLWKIMFLDASLPTAPALTSTYASIFRVFLLWSMLFDVATALSFYGINIWKYVAALRTGQIPLDDTPTNMLGGTGALPAIVTPGGGVHPPVVTPQPGVVPKPPTATDEDTDRT